MDSGRVFTKPTEYTEDAMSVSGAPPAARIMRNWFWRLKAIEACRFPMESLRRQPQPLSEVSPVLSNTIPECNPFFTRSRGPGDTIAGLI